MEKFRMDVARWVIPSEIGDPAAVTLRQMATLLYRNIGLRAVLAFRVGQWLKTKRVPGAPGLIQRLIHRRYGLEIKIGMPTGGGLYVAHTVGTVISAECIGENCSVIAAVTVGMRNEHAFPRIGDQVFLGAGARVLGGIELGDASRIAANAVVIGDVAPGTAVGGIPARPLGATSS